MFRQPRALLFQSESTLEEFQQMERSQSQQKHSQQKKQYLEEEDFCRGGRI